jgi:hypothetical protein
MGTESAIERGVMELRLWAIVSMRVVRISSDAENCRIECISVHCHFNSLFCLMALCLVSV